MAVHVITETPLSHQFAGFVEEAKKLSEDIREVVLQEIDPSTANADIVEQAKRIAAEIPDSAGTIVVLDVYNKRLWYSMASRFRARGIRVLIPLICQEMKAFFVFGSGFGCDHDEMRPTLVFKGFQDLE